MSLSNEAVLVTLSQRKPSRTKYDETASRKITDESDAEAGSARVTKVILDAKGFKLGEIFTIFGQVKKALEYNSHPWARGTQVMPVKKLGEFMEYYRKTMREIEILLPKAVEELPEIKANAEKRLGTMFKEGEFPGEDDLLAAFFMDVKIWPIPENSNDIRVTQNADIVGEALAAQIAEKSVEVTRSLWSVFYAAVKKFCDTIDNGDVKVTKPLIDGLQKALDHIPDMNITNEAEIDKMREEAQALVNYSAADYREFPAIRNQAAENAKSILKKMESYL